MSSEATPCRAAAREVSGTRSASPARPIHSSISVEHVPNARTEAVEDDSATFQRVEHLAEPHVSGFANLGERLSMRIATDSNLTNSEAFRSEVVVLLERRTLFRVVERATARATDGTPGERGTGRVHGGKTVVAKAGEARVRPSRHFRRSQRTSGIEATHAAGRSLWGQQRDHMHESGQRCPRLLGLHIPLCAASSHKDAIALDHGRYKYAQNGQPSAGARP